MKQIRLKDRIIKISGCNKCPLWSWEEALCIEGGTGYYMRESTPIDIPAECPLEEYDLSLLIKQTNDSIKFIE